jgi:class 3 adenylate cyclase
MSRRFERSLAFVFSDVVGSSAYTAAHGDESGRVLNQRHIDHVSAITRAHRGRIVDTAGDGAFCVFETIEDAVAGLSRLHMDIQASNAHVAEGHHLSVRTAAHFGKVLADAEVVSGEAVNFCARIASTATANEIRISRAAFHELSSTSRARCRPLVPVALKGFGEGIPVLAYEWRDLSRFPVALSVQETGVELVIPDKPLVTIGRLRTNADGTPANDLVISHPEAQKSLLISRWHLELRRAADGMVVRSVSDRATELNGAVMKKGADHPLRVGDLVRLPGVLTLAFAGESLTRSAISTRDGPA